MRKVFDEIQALLGILVAIPAIVSLIQHWHEIQIADVLTDALSFYRGLATLVFGWLYAGVEKLAEVVGWEFRIPVWLKDLHTLSVISTSIFARAFRLAGNTANGWSFWPSFLLIALSGLGLLTIPFMMLAMVGVLNGQSFPNIRTVAWATTLGVVAFYVTNGLLIA